MPSKPSSQSLRLPGASDRNSQRLSQLTKRYSHDEMLLQLGVSTSPCGLLDDNLCSTSDTLASHRHWRIPKVHSTRSYTNTYTKPTQSLDYDPFSFSASLSSSGFRRDRVGVKAALDQVLSFKNMFFFSPNTASLRLITLQISTLVSLLKNTSCCFPAGHKAHHIITFGQVHPFSILRIKRRTS